MNTRFYSAALIFSLVFFTFSGTSHASNRGFFQWIDDKINAYFFEDKTTYNKALRLYDKKYFSLALDNFNKIECQNVSNYCADIAYNKGRVKYDLSDDLKWEDKISALKDSLSDFENSKLLRPIEDTETEQNIEILKKLIEEEKKKEEERKKKEEEEEKDKEDNKQGQKPNQNWGNKREYWDNYSKNKDKELSDFEREMIKDRAKALREDEKNNQKYFWKKPEKNWNPFGQDFYRLFWRMPKHSFPRNEEKRDW